MAKKNSDKAVTFEMLTEFYSEFMKPQFESLRKDLKKGFSRLEDTVNKNSESIQELRVETRHVKDEVKGLKGELSDTPTRKEFSELKTKVKTLQAS